MAAEYIYEYWKTEPTYTPTKFDIVGGLEGSIGEQTNINVSNYINKLGGIVGAFYGGGEYSVSEDSLYDIDVTDTEQIITIGGNDSPSFVNKTASTVETGLKEMFAMMESYVPKHRRKQKIIPGPKKGKKKAKARRRGRGETDNISDATAETIGPTPPIKFSDTTDETLQSCPCDTSDNGIFDGGSESDSSVELIDGANESGSDSDDSDEYLSDDPAEGSTNQGAISIKTTYDAIDAPSKKNYLEDVMDEGDDYDIALEIEKSPEKKKKLKLPRYSKKGSAGVRETITYLNTHTKTQHPDDNILEPLQSEITALIDSAYGGHSVQDTFDITEFMI